MASEASNVPADEKDVAMAQSKSDSRDESKEVRNGS